MKLDPRGSAVLSEEACRHRLEKAVAASGTGRIAINGDPSPHVIPVNFTMVGGGIVIRLGPGWAAFHLDGTAVTFEADEVSGTGHAGWSVVVEGIARAVPYDDVARLGSNLPTPMVTVPGVRVFEICPFKVTGRAVEPDLRGERSDLVAVAPGQADRRPQDLHLGRDAAQELASALHSVLGDLNTGINDTDDAIFRGELLERRRLLEGIAEQLTVSDAT